MAVSETGKRGTLCRFVWQPDEEAIRSALCADAQSRPAFDRVLARARAGFAPRVWLREVAIVATGDAFVQLSGCWLEGERVAACLSGARQVWVYAATAGDVPSCGEHPLEARWLAVLGRDAVLDALTELAAQLPVQTGECVGHLSPGLTAGWPADQLSSLTPLLDAPAAGVALSEDGALLPPGSMAGLLYTAPAARQNCAGCGCGGCAGGCPAAMQ